MTQRTNTASRVRSGTGEKDGKKRPVSYVVILACGCTRTYKSPAPIKGTAVTCGGCWKSAIVMHVAAEHRVRCRVCSYSRGFGRAAYLADRAAQQHARAKGHATDVYEGGRKTFTHIPEGVPEQLTLDNADEPPF